MLDEPSRLEPNSLMVTEQLKIAACFMEELILLEFLLPLPKGMTLKALAPLFFVPKPGQLD